MSFTYLDLLSERVAIFDGAMGSNIQLRNLQAQDFGGSQYEGCNEYLNVHKPNIIEDIHNSFFEVGCDVIETNTFGAFSVVLSEYGLEDAVEEINSNAVKIAKRARASHSSKSRPLFIAGSVGPGTKMPSLGQIGFDELFKSYFLQIQTLVKEGVDLILIETVFDLLQAKCAILAAREAFSSCGRTVPIQTQVTMELTGRMLPGTEIGAALTTLHAMKIDVLGINCATGPAEMTAHFDYLSTNTSMFLSCLPNAGLPKVLDGKMHYDLGPDEFVRYLRELVTRFNLNAAGGCCGTTPEYIEMLKDSLRDFKPSYRNSPTLCQVSSIYSPVNIEQDASVLVVGEKTNANGSKAFRDAMLSGDIEGLLSIASEQIAEGAHLLDVCVDYTGEDGELNMSKLMKRLATESTVPIMIDSTEADVIEAALKTLGSRPIINSVNLEEGKEEGSRLDKFLKLAHKYGTMVVATCIDERGQARDRQWKLSAAKAIVEIAQEHYGLSPSDILIDPLVMPISTGMEESRSDGYETIEAIRLIKDAIPGIHTIVGLSNISFGLNPAARQALNSVFLQECLEAGLDAAIMHAGKILPLNRLDDEVINVCRDLIYDRRNVQSNYDPLARLIELFIDAKVGTSNKSVLTALPLESRLKQRIIDGEMSGIEDDLTEALTKYSALEIINDFLLDGMRVVGDLFGSGKMQLPFVLKSAETMKRSVSFLEPHMDKSDSTGRGSIVLATVVGDVHDIGKNLVDIILSNNGFKVHNLGIKVSINEMIEAALNQKADAIGMSGLLVKSTLIMRSNLEELNNRNLSHIPVLLGGAALTRRYVEHDLRSLYKGRVFYGKDAFEGLSIMNRLMEISSGLDDPDFGRVVAEAPQSKRRSEIQNELPETQITRSPFVSTTTEVFEPPFIGTRVARGIPLGDLAKYLNETSLFRNQWGYRPLEGESDKDFKDRVREVLRQTLDYAKKNNLLMPQVVWGYFRAASEGNKLNVYDETQKLVAEFSFPRQKQEPYFCISDFFKPVGEVDYVAFQVVTMGKKVSQRTKELFESNQYNLYVQLHGLGVEMAEALAEYWHKRIREEWGFGNEDDSSMIGLFRQKYRGGRYSFGYPACPRLEDNETVVNLLDASRIDVTVSEGFQLHPEQTTLAIICHHPQAKYFVA